jgi:type II secretion system protein N
MNRYRMIGFYVGVVCWGVIVAALVVHLFFPYQWALRIAFQNVVGSSRMAVSMDGVRATSTGVHIKKALIGHEAMPGRPIMELSDVAISWRPWSLLTGTLSITSQASAYRGTLKCDVLGIPVLKSDNPYMTVNFRNIDLSKYPAGALPWLKGMTGTADGWAAKEVALIHPIKEKGAFRLTITNGEIRELFIKNLPGVTLPFKEIKAEGRLEGSQVIIDKVFLNGSGISMKGSGILIKGDVQPTLSLKLYYESQSKAIPLPPKGVIAISGSQWSPTVTLSTDVQEAGVEKKQP